MSVATWSRISESLSVPSCTSASRTSFGSPDGSALRAAISPSMIASSARRSAATRARLVRGNGCDSGDHHQPPPTIVDRTGPSVPTIRGLGRRTIVEKADRVIVTVRDSLHRCASARTLIVDLRRTVSSAAYHLPMTMARPSGGAVVLMVVVAAAVAVMVVPIRATYLNDVGSDTVEYRTASCGLPIASLLGGEPELDGGSEAPIGKETSTPACEAASGKRVAGALALLLAAAVGWGLSRRRSSSVSTRRGAPASS